MRIDFATGRNRLVAAFAALSLLLVAGFVPAVSAQTASTQSSPSWWSAQYSFREGLTLTNPFSTNMTAYPFFVYLTFPPSSLSDASTEVRVIDQNGTELPSTVLDQASSNGSVTWAWLLVLASIPASSSSSLEVYYGNPVATVPAYRTASASENVSSGPILLALSPTEPGSSSFKVAYQNTYNQTFSSKVAYVSDSPHSYGGQGFASEPETAVSPWETFAGEAGTTGAYSSYLAGEFRLTQALVITDGAVMIARLLTTSNSSAVSDLTLTDVVDSSPLATLGQVATSYDSSSRVLSSSVAGAHLNYASDTNVTGFEVGSAATVKSEVSSNTLGMDAGPSAGNAAALSWDFGGGSKVGAVQLVTQWTVAPSPSGLQSPLPSSPLTGLVKVGTEESLTVPTTQAESFWNANMPMRNVSISKNGLSLPVSPTGAEPVANQLSLNGMVSYTVPSGISHGWVPEVVTVGNAIASATTGFYSVQVPGFVDSVRVIPQDGNSHGEAQLMSPKLTLPRSVSRTILIQYKAMFAGVGGFSQQSLYAALDIGSASGALFNETLLVPALGSAQNDTCSSLLVPRDATPAAAATVNGSLIADGSWRTLKIDLNSLAGTSSLAVRLRFCAATTQPFAGEVELDVAQAGVSVESQATNFLAASISPSGSTVNLALNPGASFEPASLEFSGNVSIPLVAHTPLSWDGRAALSGTLDWPTVGAPPGSRNSTGGSQVSLLGARIFSPLLSLDPLVLVNGTSIRVSPAGQTINVLPDQIAPPGSSPKRFSIALSFPVNYLSIDVADSGGRPLPGASIAVNGQGRQLNNATTTGANGTATLPLMPGAYNLTASFRGSDVGTANVQLDANQSVKISAGVDLTTLRVKDILGSPIQGASVGVEYGSASLNLTTDSKGLASFSAIANAVYNVTVSVGGDRYYTGTVTTSIDGAVVQLSTSYLSQSTSIDIGSGLVLTLVWVAAGFYIYRRRQARRVTT